MERLNKYWYHPDDVGVYIGDLVCYSSGIISLASQQIILSSSRFGVLPPLLMPWLLTKVLHFNVSILQSFRHVLAFFEDYQNWPEIVLLWISSRMSTHSLSIKPMCLLTQSQVLALARALSQLGTLHFSSRATRPCRSLALMFSWSLGAGAIFWAPWSPA